MLREMAAWHGAHGADLPPVDRFEAGDPTALIRTGHEVVTEPDRGLVRIVGRG